MIKKGKQKLMKIAEIIHLKFFGHSMSSVMASFVGDLSLATVGMLFSSGLVFVMNVVSARILGPLEYGKFQVIYTIAQFFIVLMLFGLNTATVKYLSESQQEDDRNIIKATSIVFFFLITVLVASVLLFFDIFFKNIIGVSKYIFDLSVYFALLISYYYFLKAVLQGLKKIRILIIGDNIYAIGAMVVFFLFILFGNTSFKSVYNSFSIGYILVIIFFLLHNRIIFSKKTIRLVIAKKIFKYGTYAILGSVSGILLGNIDKLVLNKFFGAEAVGLYAVYALASTVVFSQLVNIFITVFFPYSSGSRNKASIARKINKISKTVFFAVFLFSCIIMLGVLALMKSKYSININYIILFSINAGLSSIFQIKMWLLNSEGIKGVRKTVQGTLFVGLLNLILNFVFIPMFGIYGTIISTIISSFILFLYFTNQINKFFIHYEYYK